MIDINILEPYFRGAKKHSAYDKTVELYDALKLHANGEKPEKLLSDYRPSETKEIRDYRLKIFEPVTMEYVRQIINVLSKIRRASDWNIKYNSPKNAKISEQETLEKYCESNFPYYSSATNWVFSVLLKNYLIDSNCCMLLSPIEAIEAANEYIKPYPIVFNSNQIFELNSEFAVLKSKEKSSYKYGNNYRYDGEVFFVVDKTTIARWERSEKSYSLVSEYNHNLGRLPIVRSTGLFFDSFDKYAIYESRISAIVPRLNKVVRQDSDLDAAVVTHLYPEAWEYATQPCDNCFDAEAGICTGKVNNNGKTVVCGKCNGTGIIANASPYKKMVVRGANINMGEQQAPIPPKGYISKPIEIVKMQSEFIEANAYKALAAVNMQFLMQEKLTQSGIAKEVDRDELNNFVHAIAEDIVSIMDNIYSIICDMRYSIVEPLQSERNKMLPFINVPERFDVLSLSYLFDEVTKATNEKLNPVILQSMLIEYVGKKFYAQTDIRDMLTASLQLDPMPCKTEDEKAMIKQMGGVTDNDYIISCKMPYFIRKAKEQHDDFYLFPREKQLEILSEYAEEVKNENKETSSITIDNEDIQ